MPYVKNKIAVNVPRRSGFDKSHRHSGTLECGTITPLLFDEVIPNSRVSLKVNIAAQLPPLVSDTYMNVKLKAEAFFVPMRILSKSFEDFFCDFPRRIFTASSSSVDEYVGYFRDVRAAVPFFAIDPQSSLGVPLGPKSLLDYLGCRILNSVASGPAYQISALPLIAYHLVWQEWYRNPRVQNPAFAPDFGEYAASPNVIRAATLPFQYFHRGYTDGSGTSVSANNVIPVSNSLQLLSMNCADGVSLFSLRQRNFGLDYFSGSRVSAQQGSPASVTIGIPAGTDAAGGSTSVSIAQIRAQNSLQQFRERNNIPSPRMTDQVRARYNANLSDGVAQRPICIGFAEYDVASRGVDQTAPAGASPSSNPFDGIGAQYGRAYASGSDFIIEDFTVNEPGYILVNVTLVPDVTYSTGIPRLFHHYYSDGSITDMACSLLQNVGDQPVYQSELLPIGTIVPGVFGYQDRYADFMFCPSRVSGLLRDGESFDSFVLQRSFSGAPSLNTSFLEIPKTYLDQVLQVSSSTSGLAAWFDSLLNYKVSMPLAEFSIPSLQDPAYEHGEHVVLKRNGQIF